MLDVGGGGDGGGDGDVGGGGDGGGGGPRLFLQNASSPEYSHRPFLHVIRADCISFGAYPGAHCSDVDTPLSYSPNVARLH